MSYSKECDVFEQIRQYDLSKMANDRRFSFSVPADLVGKSDFDPLYDGGGDCGKCGECVDCLDGASAFVTNESDAEYAVETDEVLSIPSERAVISEATDPISKMIAEGNYKLKFKIPPHSARDARWIWVDADLDDIVPFKEIEEKLYTWALKFAELESKGGEAYITWKTMSDCKCVSTWHNFVRWILCACLSGTS